MARMLQKNFAENVPSSLAVSTTVKNVLRDVESRTLSATAARSVL